MFCWPYFDLFDYSCTWVLLCIFNRYKFTGFCTPAFFYSFCHILNLEVDTMRWPTDSATVHLGVVCHSLLSVCKFLPCMCLGTAKETSVNSAVVFLCLFYSLLATCEISQKDSIFYWQQVPATWCMDFMFSRRLGNFVYIVKITHNKECQLSGPLARVLISSQRCKINQKFLNIQIKPCKFHVNRNVIYVKR